MVHGIVGRLLNVLSAFYSAIGTVFILMAGYWGPIFCVIDSRDYRRLMISKPETGLF